MRIRIKYDSCVVAKGEHRMAVNVDVKDIATTIKTIPYRTVWVFIIIVDGFLLFTPKHVAILLGLDQISEGIRPYLGIVFISAAAILLISIVGTCIKHTISSSRYRGRNAKQRLDKLSDYGKRIVRGMYESESHTALLPVTDATVNCLHVLSIIGRSGMSDRGAYFDHFLQPWVIDYLSKHPDYLGQMPAANTEMFEIGC